MSSLFDHHGQHLYMTPNELRAFLEAASQADREVRIFCLVLAYTGCRISEALALTGKSIDFGQKEPAGAAALGVLQNHGLAAYSNSDGEGKDPRWPSQMSQRTPPRL